jgi:hypothetical protein
MKILFRWEPCASAFIYNGIKLELENLGHECAFWHPERNSAFDFFNQFKPDIAFLQGYNLDRATIKICNNNPDMRLVLKVGVFGTIQNESDITEYEMLFASDQEKQNLELIQNKNRIFLFNYHTKSYNDYILGGWQNIGYNTFALPPMGDKYNFYPEYNKNIAGDIVFVGGYWVYKGKNINKYILPLCHPVGKYNIKIFGNQSGWSCPQYSGMIGDNLVRQALSSAKINPCCHEPQSTRYGFEILSRLFNGILCKSLIISDYVESINDLFPDGEIPMFKDPKYYHDCIDYYLSHEQERLDLIEKQYNKVINNYTYSHIVPGILDIIS